MNISQHGIVKGIGWIAYNHTVIHVDSKIFCMFNGKTYELEFDKDSHLVEKEVVDTSDLIIRLNKAHNQAVTAIEFVEKEIKDFENARCRAHSE
ncbi:MAG: hypothetical protein CMB80_05470 [Flammeovirgaceae bacterium]|nr:hypothetical protein [Flammeovirgaceae bacterium]|tara:strand:+ start:3154 stop:3435 length:282 start_codon:yes stop_codon:yes gene_type:complete